MPQHCLYLVLLLLALAGCKKGKDTPAASTVPPATQDGRQTLACKIDKSVMVFAGAPGGMLGGDGNAVSATLIATANNRPHIYIHALDRNSGSEDITIFAYTDSLQLNKPMPITGQGSRSNQSRYDNLQDYYYADVNSIVTFTRFDSSLVAGRFEMHATNSAGKTVHITEGWFDLRPEY